MKRISKKILITILSLTLLFSISCNNEDKTGGGGVSPTSPEADSEISPSSPADSGGSGTGSTPITGDDALESFVGGALVSSVPSPTGGIPVTSSDSLYNYNTNVTLKFITNESDLVGNPPFGFTKEEYFGLSRTNTNYTLIIRKGLVTFKKNKYTSFSNEQLLYDRINRKYKAGVSENDNDEASKEYIEFKLVGNSLTNFQYVSATLTKDTSYGYGTKAVFKQQ